jgi:GNAT superfamily N-acetyltransferase
VYEGEARFLRALAYHELVINFAKPYADGQGSSPGVPYRETALNSIAKVEEAKSVGRGTVANVYTKMLEDLQFAEDNLPATRAGSAKVTRATKGAAIALKQRLRLHQGNYAEVIREGNKMISTAAPFTSAIGAYALAPTPQAAFPGGATTTAENIFSIENSSDDNPGVNGSLPAMFGSDAQPPAGIGGRGLIAISPILYNAPFWSCTDLRRTELTQATTTRYFTRKYRDALTRSDYAPIVRYAEVILNQAEAEARANNTTRALALLNAVRNRAITVESERYTAASFPTTTALIGAILNERRIEFVAEGFRWDDIHRLAVDPDFRTNGIPRKLANTQAVLANYACRTPLTITGSTAPVAYNNTFFLWPIPSIEVSVNPTLRDQQNPGY